jgi:transcriptional regulator with XRE-family HTH domain
MSDRMTALIAKGRAHKGFKQGYAERQALARIGEQLRAARDEARLSQSELAEVSGLTQSAISRLENGTTDRSPELRTVIRFLRGCGQELDLELGWRRQGTTAAALRTAPTTRRESRSGLMHYSQAPAAAHGYTRQALSKATRVVNSAHVVKSGRAAKSSSKARTG